MSDIAAGREYEFVDAASAPDGAQLCLVLTDECMAPYFCAGEAVYVQCSRAPGELEAGIFMYGGRVMCRQWCEDYAGALHLLAANPACRAANIIIPAKSRDGLVCLGRVVTDKKLPMPQYDS